MAATRETEAALEAALREDLPALARAQETWFALSGLRERLRGTAGLAAERVRNAAVAARGAASGRDPDELEAEADAGARARRPRSTPRWRPTAARSRPPSPHGRPRSRPSPRRSAGSPGSSAPPPTGARGWPGCTARSTACAAARPLPRSEVGRLAQARAEAADRARERAQRDFTALESRIAGLDAGEEGLDAEHEGASALLGDDRGAAGQDCARSAPAAERERGSLAARKEALELGLNRKDGAGALLAATGAVTRAARLGGRAAHRPRRLRDGRRRGARRRGRRGRRRPTSTPPSPRSSTSSPTTSAAPGSCSAARVRRRRRLAGDLPAGACTPLDVVDVPGRRCGRRWSGCSFKVAVVDDLAPPGRWSRDTRDVTAVTREGDLIGAHFAAGGSSRQPSLLEVQAAVDEATERLGAAGTPSSG